jgi:hypothetical protein
LGEKIRLPIIVIEKARSVPSLKAAGGIEGLDGGEPASGIDAGFTDSGVGSNQGTGQGAENGRASETGLDLRKEAPGAVENEKRQASVRLRENRGIDMELNKAGGIKEKTRVGRLELEIVPADKGLQAAFRLPFPWMADDDILLASIPSP